MVSILVTGSAGFIGAALTERLLLRGDRVLGIDNLNPYYEVSLKEARLALCRKHSAFRFERIDLADRRAMQALFENNRFDVVVSLAAQAGVRYSLDHPSEYVDANLVGFANVLEGCRHLGVRHLVFASSSSVYGANTRLPFSEHDSVDHPVSLYAATKKASELMAHSYAHLFRIPCTGLRFFTVYGPWGRPDMAYFSFTRKILAGDPIPVFNQGRMRRDFTYIDDIVEGMARVIDSPPEENATWQTDPPDPATSSAPYRIYNIGNNRPVGLLDFIAILERHLGRSAKLEMLPMQPGDVAETMADLGALDAAVGFRPETTLDVGMGRFVRWYREFYAIP